MVKNDRYQPVGVLVCTTRCGRYHSLVEIVHMDVYPTYFVDVDTNSYNKTTRKKIKRIDLLFNSDTYTKVAHLICLLAETF